MTLTPEIGRTSAQPGDASESGLSAVAVAWPVAAIGSLTLVAGAASTVWGLSCLEWPSCIPFTAQGFANVWTVLGVATAVVAAVARRLRCGPLAVGAVVAVIIATLAGSLWPLLVVGACSACWLVVGDDLLARLGDETVEGWWPRLLAGAAVLGTIVGLIAHLPVNGTAIYGGLVFAPLGAAAMRGRRLWSAAREGWGRLAAPTAVGWKLDTALAALSVLHFTVALMPEVGHDALAYQMFVPAHLATRGSWGFDASIYAWAVMPMLGNWLLAIGYVLAGETGARLINCLFVLVLTRLVHACVRWAGGSPTAAVWAAILYLAAPLTFTVSSSLFVESIWASFLVGWALMLFRFAAAGGGAGLPTCGLLCGGAMAAKAISLVMLPPVAVAALAAWPRAVARLQPAACLSAAAALSLVGGVPYVTAWWLTGNPLFPFANAFFRSPLFAPVNVVDRRWHDGLSWTLPYTLTFDSARYIEGRPGAAGFQWLALLPGAAVAVLGSRHRRGIVLFAAGLGSFAAIFTLTSYVRYAFPAGCLLTAALAVGLAALPRGLQPAVAVLTTAVVLLNCVFLNAGPTYYDAFPLRTLLSVRQREAYLAGRAPVRKAVAVVNELNVDRTPVAVLADPLAAGLTADALYANWYHAAFSDAVAQAATDEDFAAVLRRFGADHVILQRNWGNPLTRELAEKVGEPLFAQAGVAVLRIRERYRFVTELLRSPRLAAGWEGWDCPPCVRRTPDGEMEVTESCHARQVVPARAGVQYRAAVTARAAFGTAPARVQVVWLDGRREPLRVDIQVFTCGPDPAEHAMLRTAPPGTAAASVYLCAHTAAPVIIGGASLRH